MRGYAFATPGTTAKKYLKKEEKKRSGGKVENIWTVNWPSSAIPAQWAALVRSYERHASVPLEDFLLAADDPLLLRARRMLANGSRRSIDTDWARCEDRHAQARYNEGLGQKRPLTSWESGGSAQLFIGGWLDWARAQTERVLDLCDIQLLRLVLQGVDPLYKTIVWNLSQNVDRQGGNARFSICPCLTPTMIPFITNRGGPASGLEALRLQGIPTRELLLTRESESDLADLAGNAMTSTVVGAAIIAGLSLVVDKVIKRIDERDAKRQAVEMDVDEADADVEQHIQGDDALAEQTFDLAKCAPLSPALLVDAARSARLCVCEGRAGVTTDPLLRCADCGETCCKACSGRPEHRLESLDVNRLACGDFESELKAMLPMRLSLTGFAVEALESLRRDGVSEKDYRAYIETVAEAVEGTEFRFQSLKRQAVWSVTYGSPRASLDLYLNPAQPEWRLTVKPPPAESRHSRLRALLVAPVARLSLTAGAKDLIQGIWDIRAPVEQKLDLTFEGQGTLVPSWKADLGLIQNDLQQEQRWTEIRITAPSEAAKLLDHDVSGVYRLLPNCGTAEGMLHKRVDAPADAPALYLFLDPSRDGPGSKDFAVISTDPRRHDFGFVRPIVCALESGWRPNDEEGPQTVSASVNAIWTPSPDVSCVATASVSDDQPTSSQSAVQAVDLATCALPPAPLKLRIDAETCEHAQALLSVRVPLAEEHAGKMWPAAGSGWSEVDLAHKGKTVFEALAWATERLPALDVMGEFTEIVVEGLDAPEVSWFAPAMTIDRVCSERITGDKFLQALRTPATITEMDEVGR